MAVGPSAPPIMPIEAATPSAKPMACAEEGDEYAHLRGGSEKETYGVGDEGTEIGHRSDAQEYETWINAELYAQVQVINEPGAFRKAGPCNVTALEQLRMVHARARQIAQQHTESYRKQEHRLELLNDSQV